MYRCILHALHQSYNIYIVFTSVHSSYMVPIAHIVICFYIVPASLSHHCYIIVTSLLHHCYIILTSLLHLVTSLLHHCYIIPTQEKIPLPGDSVDVLLPLTVQKGKHFAEKFSTEDSTTFWYQDEKGIVSYSTVYYSKLYYHTFHLAFYLGSGIFLGR